MGTGDILAENAEEGIAVRTTMLPLMNVASGDCSLTNEPVYILFTPITNLLDIYIRNLATNSGHALILEETGRRLNPDPQDFLLAVVPDQRVIGKFRHIAAIVFTLNANMNNNNA
jgi:hypothetical protein